MIKINENIFSDTEVAFSSMSDKDLKKAYLFFRILDYPLLATLGIFFTKLALRIHLPIKGLIRKTIFNHFCGGESIEKCQETIDLLSKYNVGTILDYSVEGEKKKQVFEDTTEELIKTIVRAKDDSSIPFCVFKMTGVGRLELYEKVQNKSLLTEEETREFEETIIRVDRICQRAYMARKPIFIDAEESWIQNAIDDIVYSMMKKYNKEKAIVYNTIQFYRKNSVELLISEHERAMKEGFHYGVKMVRGAYMEKERERAIRMHYPSPINDTKLVTDECYDKALLYCVENLETISFCAGTHNEKSSMQLAKMLEIKKEEKNSKVYFAQLYGMSNHISFNLANLGFNVAKYVPYGPVKYVMPYLFRRAEENTSIAGQSGRELTLIRREMERRRRMKNSKK